jgi:hypothetical protein
LVLGAVVVAAWLLMWAGATVMNQFYSTDPERAWPMGLGTLDRARQRYPTAPASAAAFALVDEVAKVGIDIAPRTSRTRPEVGRNTALRETIGSYLTRQTRKPSPAIEPPGEELADYLAAHAGDLATIRSIILGDEPVVWAVDRQSRRQPIPNLLGHMVLTRLLVVNALDRARRNEPEAWEDLRAAMALSRGLWERPEMISALIALAIDRNISAAARKMPLPPPAWFADFLQFDYRRALLAARQAETSAISEAIYAEMTVDASRRGLIRMVDTALAPYTRLCTADSIDAERHAAASAAATTACDVDPREMTRRRREELAWWNYPARRISSVNLDSPWQRLNRFRVELEATERALRLRAGAPPLPRSSCSDGKWIYEGSGFRFSRDIPMPGPIAGVPLEFALDASE